MKEEHERIPLRTILQNFLNHVENLDSDNLEGSYEKEFQELKLFSEILKTSDQYCCSEGQKEVNRKKNRYKDILPFDVSRVILAGYAGVPGSDYINANFIKGASGSLAYIASQGPLPHTVNDFWRMVVECKVQVIVMACNEEEAGKHKCENYWVDKEGEEKQFGMVAVRLVKASVVCPDFLVRTMMLKYANSQSVSEERTVCQFHYSAWPDHGVPPLVRPLLDMVRLVRDTQASETLPVLVHCSAGCGRTGTICAIDYVWGLLRAGKLTNDFSLFKLVRDMRKQRIAMVQTKEQYVLVHHAVRELFCEQLRMIDSHPYENIDVNGMPLIKECSDSESEPTYAVIGNNSCDDEKQDNKEKEVYAPPIPQKKRLHTPSSKQEKEVENLTEKQRLISQQSSDGSSFQGSGTPQKPRIAKLKAIFERGSPSGESHTRSKLRSTQQVTRSHSLGAVSKPDTHHRHVEGTQQNENNLSTSSHKLNVMAHSSPVCPQPALPIKRSKSLKVLGSGDQYKLIFTTVSRDSPGKALKSAGRCENSVKKREAGPSTMGSSKLKEQLECEKVKTKSAPSCVKSTNFNGGTADYNTQPSLNSRASEHLVPMSSQHRSSLDSFSTEGLLPFPLVNANSGVTTKVGNSSSNSSNSTYGFNHMKTYNEQKTLALDKDACQIWQDCRNYLISNSKCDGYLPKGLVNKRQQSDLTGSMLKHKQFQNYSVDSQKKITSVVVGLGVRERRNSFRQAVGTPKESSAVLPEKERCNYESGWVTGNVQQNVDDIAKKSISNKTQLFSEVTSANSLHCSPNVSNAYVDVYPNSVVPVTSLQVAVAGSLDISASNYNSRIQRLNKSTQDKKTGIQRTSDEVSFCETVIKSPYNMVLKHNASNAKTGVGHKYIHNSPIQESRCLGQSKLDSISVEQIKNVPVLKKTFQKSAWPLMEQGGSKLAPDLSVRNLSGSSSAALKQLSTGYQDVNVSFAKRAPSSEGLSLFKSVPASLKSKSKSFIGKSGTDVGASKSNNTSVNNSGSVPGRIKCVCDVTKPDIGKKVVSKSNPTQQIIPLCEKNNGLKAETSRRMVDARNHNHSTSSVAASRSGVEAEDVLSNKRLKEVSSLFSDSDSKTSANKAENSPINEKLSPNHHHQNEQDVVSYGLVAGVQLRRGTRDDMACQGPSTSAKVRRHASVVLLRHSLIETTPLTVWGPEQQGFTSTNSIVSPKRQCQDTGGDPRGVDLNTAPASTRPQGDSGIPLSRTLEALHLKKPASHTAEVPSASSGKTYGVIGIKSPRAQKKQHYL